MEKATTITNDWIWNEAVAAGKEALEDCTPTPMVVYEANLLTDEPKQGGQRWHVPDGVCGFAWVNVKPGNSNFARWLKAMGHGRTDSYYKGVSIWITVGNQSMQKKIAYGEAVAEVFRKHGIKACCMNRLD